MWKLDYLSYVLEYILADTFIKSDLQLSMRVKGLAQGPD